MRDAATANLTEQGRGTRQRSTAEPSFLEAHQVLRQVDRVLYVLKKIEEEEMADQTRFWCLVSNPRTWPIFAFLESARQTDAWRISPNLVQIPNQVAKGQYAIVRVGTGGGAHHPPGIYAICRLLSGAVRNDSPDVPLPFQGRAFDGLYQVVVVEFLARFPEAPLTVDRLAREATLREQNISTGLIKGREISIFEINESDFNLVAELLQWNRPVA